MSGVDFWHDWRPGAGTIRHLGFPEREQGPVFARFAEDLEWRSPDGEQLFAERRTFRFAGIAGGERLLDLEIALTAARDLAIGASPFGFLAFRVAESMTPYDGGGVSHPTPFYCRNDGWLGAACTGLGERSLREGECLALRYRLLAHDGPAGDGARIEQAWQGFARPPVAKIVDPTVRVGRSKVPWE